MAKKTRITLKNKNAFVRKLNTVMRDETKEVNERYLYQYTQKITNMAAGKMYKELKEWYDQYTPKKYIRSPDGENLLSTVTTIKYVTRKKYNYTFGLKLDYTKMNLNIIEGNPFPQHMTFDGDDFRLGLIDIITNTDYGHIPGILGYHHSQVDLFGSAENFIKENINKVKITEIASEAYDEVSTKHGIKIKTKR